MGLPELCRLQITADFLLRNTTFLLHMELRGTRRRSTPVTLHQTPDAPPTAAEGSGSNCMVAFLRNFL